VLATTLQGLFGSAWHTNSTAILAALGADSGSGSPNGVLTPISVGQAYFDSTNNVFYLAYGTTNTSWSQIGAADLLSADTFAQAGSSAATFPLEGNLNVQTSAAGVNPGATAADNVLAVYSLPASFFDKAGRGISIAAAGSFAANADNKRVKIIVNATTAVVGSTVTGGTTICDTGTVATNGSGWLLEGSVFKYGAAASNTQLGIHNQAQIGAAVASMLAPSLITATESGAILIAITGNATTAATDIIFNFMQINATN
jgi:hypothetical protein